MHLLLHKESTEGQKKKIHFIATKIKINHILLYAESVSKSLIPLGYEKIRHNAGIFMHDP